MNNNYWTKSDYRKKNETRRALEKRNRNLELMDVDHAGRDPGTIPVEPPTLPKVDTDAFGRKVDIIARKTLDRMYEEQPSRGLNQGPVA